ncbi:MAG: Ig-like domain-containing protein [Longimicrobiales bacterium]
MRAAITVTLMLLFLAGCGEGEPSGPEDPVATSLAVEPATSTLTAVGASALLVASVRDQDGAPMPGADLTWASTDATVATVSAAGQVTAVGPGEARIAATAGAATDTAAAIVAPEAATLTIRPAFRTLHAIGDSARLEAVVTDRNGHAIEGAQVSWTSTAAGVATVDAAGWVVAQANGTAVIRAEATGIADEATVAVDQKVAAVAVSPGTLTLAEGDTARLSAVVTDSNGVAVPADVAWSIDDPGIASVGGAGLVHASRTGHTTAMAAADGVTGMVPVEVLNKIVFQRDDGADQDLFVMNTDGSDATAVAFHRLSDQMATWSPNGTRIAFSASREGNSEIYSIAADGSNPTNLTLASSGDIQPDWSSTGVIAFASDRGATTYGIWTMAPDGSEPTSVIDLGYHTYQPAWSPDGTKLAVTVKFSATDYDVYVYDPAGPTLTPVTDDTVTNRHPTWSADGARIAFASDRDPGDGSLRTRIWVMNADGSGAAPLSDPPAGFGDSRPSWRPAP